ncbi:MAG: DUF3025 domain-containing protein [bacterium]
MPVRGQLALFYLKFSTYMQIKSTYNLIRILGFPIQGSALIRPASSSELNQLLTDQHKTKTNQKISFKHPEEGLEDLAYETRVGTTGVVETRMNSWHDTLNAYVWSRYPNIKISLNACHLREIDQHQSETRTVIRDALTHFDECGIIVLSSQANLLDLIDKQQWQSLFIDHRDCWGKTLKVLLFGHATMELCRKPHIGLTAKAMLIEVEPTMMELSDNQLRIKIDQSIAQLIDRNQLSKPADLAPLPVLGVPGAYPDQGLDFYSNSAYFCPWRKKHATLYKIT